MAVAEDAKDAKKLGLPGEVLARIQYMPEKAAA